MNGSAGGVGVTGGSHTGIDAGDFSRLVVVVFLLVLVVVAGR